MVNSVSYRNVVHHAKGNKNARGFLCINLSVCVTKWQKVAIGIEARDSWPNCDEVIWNIDFFT